MLRSPFFDAAPRQQDPMPDAVDVIPYALSFRPAPDAVDAVLRAAADQPSAFAIELADPVTKQLLFSYVGVNHQVFATAATGADEAFRLAAAEVQRVRLTPSRDLPPFQGGVVGFVGTAKAGFFQVRQLIAIDHFRGLGWYIHLAPAEAPIPQEQLRAELSALLSETGASDAAGSAKPRATAGWNQDLTRAEFMSMVEAAKSQIALGGLDQVILSLGMTRGCATPAHAIYRDLRDRNPSPQNFFLRFGALAILGTPPSPYLTGDQTSVSLEVGAGTRRLSGDATIDNAAAADLASDPKDLQEHQLLLDLAAADLRAIAREGDVQIPIRMQVRRFSHVMHLFSRLKANLAPSVGPIEALRRIFPPAPTTGAPRAAASAAIAALEPAARGPYGGVIGVFGYDGRLDSTIIERSAWIEDGVASLRVGAGITEASVPELEYEECMQKAAVLMRVIEQG